MNSRGRVNSDVGLLRVGLSLKGRVPYESLVPITALVTVTPMLATRSKWQITALPGSVARN